MAKPSRLVHLTWNITREVLDHPKDLTRYYAEREGIKRAAAARYILQLEQAGWITRMGSSTRPIFIPGEKRRIAKSYALKGLEEDVIWSQDFRPYLNLPVNIANIAAHGFTEMVNNAIDHSDGQSVFIIATQNKEFLTLAVSDDGIGIFEKIAKALNLADRRQALFELSKGKFTTDPSRHSGEGVFFTSRMFDHFEIDANGLEFSHDGESSHDWLIEKSGLVMEHGTNVFMLISLDSACTTTEVFQQYMNVPDDYDFSKTIVPMRLAQLGDEQLISRSQAKRLIARFDRFKSVILDFKGVDEIGQAFADELFRVYRLAHPAIDISPVNMKQQVERMWLRAMAPRM